MSAGEIVLKIFLAVLTQVLLWVGSTIIVGFLIALLNKAFYKCVGRAAYKVCIITGAVGTPLHELGHALFCVIFGHKITKIKLFQPNSDDGTLGYVSHSYNPKNPYQKFGNFFIGIGPILFISGIMLLLEFLLIPQMFGIGAAISEILNQDASGLNVFFGIACFVQEMFSASSLINWRWWIYVVICALISLHMNLSKPDIAHSTSSALLTVAVFALIPIITALISLKDLSVMNTVSGAMTLGGIYYVSCLLLGVFFSIIDVLIAFIIRLIVSLFKKIIPSKKS